MPLSPANDIAELSKIIVQDGVESKMLKGGSQVFLFYCRQGCAALYLLEAPVVTGLNTHMLACSSLILQYYRCGPDTA